MFIGAYAQGVWRSRDADDPAVAPNDD